jgi:hypothetical protein
MTEKEQVIKLFNENVRGKSPDTSSFNQRHDGKYGHWLESKMGIKANSSNTPDLLGYEMKNDTTSKTTFGDWSANYYIFKKNSGYGINRTDFLHIFGKPNLLKNGRHSWSGEPCPRVDRVNSFGQQLIIDAENNIHATYNFSKDARPNKTALVPQRMQVDALTLARWDAPKLKKRVESKFNNKGWFKCLRDANGAYSSIVFGAPMTFENWIGLVKSGHIIFDSGMYEGNNRPYSQWRADNSFWNKLIISSH